MNKIKILSSELKPSGERSRVTYNIEIEDEKGTNLRQLWYEFDPKYNEYACHELIDPVVVQFLSHAIRGGYDIESDMPMGERLYFQLTNEFIPQILCVHPELKPIQINVTPKKFDFHPTEVGTGISLGVDSFTTYFELTDESIPENYRLTLLGYFQNGQHHLGNFNRSTKEDRKKFLRSSAQELRLLRNRKTNCFWLFAPILGIFLTSISSMIRLSILTHIETWERCSCSRNL